MRLRDTLMRIIADDIAGPRAPADELKRELRSLQRATDGELIGHHERIVKRPRSAKESTNDGR